MCPVDVTGVFDATPVQTKGTHFVRCKGTRRTTWYSAVARKSASVRDVSPDSWLKQAIVSHCLGQRVEAFARLRLVLDGTGDVIQQNSHAIVDRARNLQTVPGSMGGGRGCMVGETENDSSVAQIT